MKTVSRRLTVLTTIALMVLIVLSGCKPSKPVGSPSDQFTKAQDFQKQEKYLDAITVYRQIAKDFPKTREGANSQFMIGFIYANHLQDFTQAKAELTTFLDKFTSVADSGLVEGARFELKFMGKPIDEIPTLAPLNDQPKVAAADTIKK